jgi:hypothetical protein
MMFFHVDPFLGTADDLADLPGSFELRCFPIGMHPIVWSSLFLRKEPVVVLGCTSKCHLCALWLSFLIMTAAASCRMLG